MKKLISITLTIIMLATICSVSMTAHAATVDVKKTSAMSDIAKAKYILDNDTDPFPDAPEIEEPIEIVWAGSSDTGIQDSDENNNWDISDFMGVSGDFEYFIIDETSCAVWFYSGDDSVVTVPETLDGYTVEQIGPYAFDTNQSIKKVTLPDTVTLINIYAFFGCENLTDINLDKVLYIADYAFYNCCSLEKVNMPDIIYIGDCAFDCTAMMENQPEGLVYFNDILYKYNGYMEEGTHFVIPDGTSMISGSAFEMQDGLVGVDIPDSVEVIDNYAFFDCTSLTKVDIPSSVACIGEGAFYCCESLSEVNFADGYTDIYTDAFTNCPNLKSVTIPYTVLYIDEFAFGYTDAYDDEEDDWIYTAIDGFTITGYDDTAAQYYAEENGFEFVSLGEAPFEEYTYLLGDADCDNEVSILDATTIQLYLAKYDVEYMDFLCADADCDGELSIMDATIIQLYLAKMDVNTPIGEYIPVE